MKSTSGSEYEGSQSGRKLEGAEMEGQSAWAFLNTGTNLLSSCSIFKRQFVNINLQVEKVGSWEDHIVRHCPRPTCP